MTRAGFLAVIVFSILTSAVAVAQEAAPPQPSTAPGTCIAIGLPAVQGVEGSAVDVGNAVRELFSGFLTGPSMKVVALDARLASQASEEARQKGCGHVLTATLTRKRSG